MLQKFGHAIATILVCTLSFFSKPFFADQGTSKIEPGVTPRANMTLVGFIYIFSSLFYIYFDIHLHLLLALFEKKNVTQMFTQMIQW